MAKKGINVKKSGLSGIYYDESSVQKYRRKPDRHFYYRFKHKQRSFKEYTGWASDGMTAEITQEKKEEHKKSLNRSSIIYPRNIIFRERYIDTDIVDMQKSVSKTDDILMGNYQQQKDIIQITKVKVS